MSAGAGCGTSGHKLVQLLSLLVGHVLKDISSAGPPPVHRTRPCNPTLLALLRHHRRPRSTVGGQTLDDSLQGDQPRRPPVARRTYNVRGRRGSVSAAGPVLGR